MYMASASAWNAAANLSSAIYSSILSMKVSISMHAEGSWGHARRSNSIFGLGATEAISLLTGRLTLIYCDMTLINERRILTMSRNYVHSTARGMNFPFR